MSTTSKELKDKIARLKANTFVPEALKTKQVANLEKQLAELSAQQNETKASSSPPKEKIENPKTPAKKASAKKAKAPAKPKSVSTYKGKDIRGNEKPNCDELEKDWETRKAKRAKSEKKTRTKPVIEKVVSHVVQAAKQAINSVPLEKIKKNPEVHADKMEQVEEATLEYIRKLKSIMGDEYDAGEVSDEMKHLKEFISAREKKYEKEKKKRGGQVDDEDKAWDVTFRTKDGEFIDQTQINEKTASVAWDLFKEFGHERKPGMYLEWEEGVED